ncbi:MAG: acetyl-CoA C-acyltransferase, partial [Myxococcales bacterium]|nr:acetyl-CoA C-acyltransferase [Myxococcales bacterium]
ITGTSAIVAVHDAIRLGRIDVGIAGGVESMSNTAILVSPALAGALRDSRAAKGPMDQLKLLARLRPGDLLPQLPGVEEPSTGLTMGQHTELMVKEWKIPRLIQDEIAFRSHRNAHAATEDGRLGAEIHPLGGLDRDSMVRADTSLEKLAKLKPVFDPEQGTLTAGNSSPLTDGAAVVLLMSEERATKEGRTPLAFVKDFEHAAIDPADGLLMAPGVAVPRLLRRHGLSLADMDVVEVHEAFGGQVACNLAAWEKGWKEPAIGTIPVERL